MCATVGKIKVFSQEFEWKIPDLFLLQKQYSSLQSPEFEFLDEEWSMELVRRQNKAWVLHIKNSVYCWFDFTFYTFGIKCFDGTIYTSASGVSKVTDCNISPLAEICLSDLEPEMKKIAPHNVLTVFCNLSVKQQHCETTTAESTTQTEISEGFNTLEKNLKDLLTSGEDSDVVIKVADKEFHAHKTILRARSTVFASMFRHDMKERGTGNVDMTDCDPQTFQQFLLYVYTGKVDKLASENVCQLYQLADKYDAQDLKAECLEYMEKNLSTNNFCDVISLALRHKEPALLESATQFFVKNAKKIVTTVNWLSFMKENTLEANELTIKALNFAIPD